MGNFFIKRPEYFALVAAALNGTIGPLNRLGFSQGASHNQVAFYKCFLAFLVLLVFCLARRQHRETLFSLRAKWWHFLVLSFFGIFCLYFFETWAFSQASIPLVSFLTYAAGGITIILSAIVLGEGIGIYKIVAFLLIMAGVGMLYSFGVRLSGSNSGIVLALLGGLGYALFIFASKYLKTGSGLPHLVWLFGFGSIYLAFPLATERLLIPNVISCAVIVSLVVFPTIGGFYFTTKAIHGGEASKVQILETSDPLFATLFAYLLFRENLSFLGMVGAASIMLGLVIAMKNERIANIKEPLSIEVRNG